MLALYTMELQIYLRWDPFCRRAHYLAGQVDLQMNIYHQWEECRIEEEYCNMLQPLGRTPKSPS